MFTQAFAATSIPLTGSEVAARWDSLYSFVVGLSIFFFILVIGAMLYFVAAYRHDPKRKTLYVTGNHLLEAIWIAVPTVLLLGIFVWGYSVYHGMTQAPSDAYEVRVTGKQWLWTFQYDNGRTTVGEVFVPMNRPVKFIMTSEDVLHGFFIPNFRIKQDVVPGMYTSIWFTATVPGKHQAYCTEYCGTSHSGMLAKVVVLDEKQWEDWNRNRLHDSIPEAGQDVALVSQTAAPNTLVEQGKLVYQNKGCVACHSTDGTTKVGPTHKGMYGSKVELSDGRIVVADDNYIRNKIENPQSSVVKGYQPQMPTFKGLISEQEMNALLAYLKSLK